MRARIVAPRTSTVPLVVATLNAVLAVACERARRVDEGSGSMQAPHARDAGAAPLDGGGIGASVPRSASADARGAVTPVGGMPWRRAIDEVAGRLDRGDPPAVVAAVLGRVTEHGGGIGIESTQPWATTASIWVRDHQVEFALVMVPRLPASELAAGAGPCEGAALLGDFGDGSLLICRPFPTLRGTMDISATTDPEAGGGMDQPMVDYLMFTWRPNDGAPVPQPRWP